MADMKICRCKTPPKKPCDYCYHWFECCNYGKAPEKCYKFNKQQAGTKRGREQNELGKGAE